MSKTMHAIYVMAMIVIVVMVTVYLSYIGYTYYVLPIEERFYHEQYHWFKPSGLFGQGLGVVGTAMMFVGVFIYIAHKRYNILGKRIRLKYLLEFHIFLCTLGPILVLFHTTFKFGGIVSIAFWSMVAVVLSGVIGRFIYIRIPRSIEGRALTIDELQIHKSDLVDSLQTMLGDETEQVKSILLKESKTGLFSGKQSTLKKIKRFLKQKGKSKKDIRSICKIVGEEITLSHRISRLAMMKKLFDYWHVAHMPFAIIMLIIVVVHVIVAFSFGYNWIF